MDNGRACYDFRVKMSENFGKMGQLLWYTVHNILMNSKRSRSCRLIITIQN